MACKTGQFYLTLTMVPTNSPIVLPVKVDTVEQRDKESTGTGSGLSCGYTAQEGN